MAGTAKLSIEFFPPKTEEAEKELWEALTKLGKIKPRFVSVTYGAGGSTRDRTTRIVREIMAGGRFKPAAHLTCVGHTKEEVDALAREWQALGINHIVALRGDPPQGQGKYTPHPGGYNNAADLIGGLRRIGEFEISVGAYPEKHPDSPSLEADLDNLKAKFDAGGTRGLTQFFFDVDAYLRWRDLIVARGITAEIVPGILPIANFTRAVQFAAQCGARVPDELHRRFAGTEDDARAHRAVARAVCVEMCRRLMEEGVDAFHFYTLNRAALTLDVCRELGLIALDEAA
ncbi:methylenetetrahydrofolate reductase [NAD(P)H] [Radicibacter daui]|uniref:methylenetetrahydrofolate reductase [NAD(P)H] n=1 Tax=Radicibacter daui TaxID=3064829 RepID=UPI0040469DB1